ncbi:MAG TPA: hypothetical protein VFA11_19540 [Acidimicrobiales bacterium]|nr:hypothetical protein [Acidimicrobiales bacterium]
MERAEDRDDLEAEGIPDHFGPANPDEEGMIAPGDFPKGATDIGVTAAEQRAGDTVAERSQREVPDVHGVGGEPRAESGRLVEANSAVGELDTDEPRADAPGDKGAMSAEEDAVHVREVRR